MSETAETAAPSPQSRFTFRHRTASPFPHEYLDRQNRIAHLAFAHLGGTEQAMLFLNSDNPKLGGKPIHLAGESSDGYAAVQSEVHRLASGDLESLR